MKNILGKQKGITLIALVVTIIILIILAGITIYMIIGDNGIMLRASQSAEETRGASVEEERNIWKTNQYIDNYSSPTAETLTELINRLVSQGLLKESEKDQILGNEEKGIEATGQVTIGSRTIVFEIGEITLIDMLKKAEEDECINEDGKCDNPEHLHVGDYVDYKNPTSGSYTITAQKSGITIGNNNANQIYDMENNTLNWRVLGLDEETGGIKLISGNPMKLSKVELIEGDSVVDSIDIQNDTSPYLQMRGAEAYIYGPEEINKVGEMCKNEYAESGRSVNIEDINQAIGIRTQEDIIQYNVNVSVEEEGILQYSQKYSYENQYTPENWLQPDRKPGLVTGEITGYCFVIQDGNEEEEHTIKLENSRLKSMLFDNIDYNAQKKYWLASTGIIPFSYYSQGVTQKNVAFCLGTVSKHSWIKIGFEDCLFNSGGNSETQAYAVRPVVILKKNITKNQIKKIEDKTEEEWEYGVPM